jgi:hypothetical protein
VGLGMMVMSTIDNIVDLVDNYDRFAELASTAASDERDALCFFLERRVPELLGRVPDDRVDQMRVYYADKYYRIFNRLESYDSRLSPILARIGIAFEDDTRRRGRPIAYLVDNGLDPSRLPVLRPFFGPLGLSVVCPEAMEDTAIMGPFLDELVAQRRNVLFVSANLDLEQWTAAARGFVDAGYLVTFRNDAPIDGSSIDIWS